MILKHYVGSCAMRQRLSRDQLVNKTTQEHNLLKYLSLNSFMCVACRQVTGKRVKKVKVQRDYFIRWPLLQAVPIIGDSYDSDKLRFLIGAITSAFTRTVQGTYQAIVPEKLKDALFEFWRQHLQVPIGEQFHDAEVKIQ